jgi:two-component system, OmpR family, sensor histidine kinase ChvG
MKRRETVQLGISAASFAVIALLSVFSVREYRGALIDAQVQSLVAQGETIADAIAASAPSRPRDPVRWVRVGGEPVREDATPDPPLSPASIAPLLRKLVGATKTRARLYDHRGILRLDTDLPGIGDVLRFDLPPPRPEPPSFAGRTLVTLKTWLTHHEPAPGDGLGPQNGRGVPEVAAALAGRPASKVRGVARGDVTVSVAVPIVRSRAVRGAIVLSTKVPGWFDLVREMRVDRLGDLVAVSDGA